MNGSRQVKELALSEVEHLRIHGRTTGRRNPLTLFWTGSGVEFNARGAELWLEIETGYDFYEQWITVMINAVPVSRQMLPAGRHWVCIYRGMNAEKARNVQVIKDVQAMSGDPGSFMSIHAVRFDGGFLPVEEKPCKLEFIGDSITSGEGAIGAKAEEDWIPMWFSAVHNYTAITAAAVNAEYRVISQSGWGVLTGWDNNPHTNLPAHYEKVCGLLRGEKNQALGAGEDNDFAAWQPDVVVVNLGSNDGGAFFTPEWVDRETGRTYKQRLLEDGSFHPEDLKAFEEAVVHFLGKLRTCNPQAQIVWAYGMLGRVMMPAIYRAVDAYMAQSGDRNVSVFQLPNMTEETAGSRSHPGLLAHQEAARALAGYLKELLPERTSGENIELNLY
ncbi:SGNH/GDSL hydrolase family protein [Paenibacillus pinistramenti]|uniref:SGNH/GDSL hydrolase family protein n=1 Tax=Paenibacillus pinistramenti TaxID=1768003 RepID=UPI001108D38B|nr:SGNH/GDSL hydrolase family protein [Paenibacillus pinistramenti]